jgi:glycosyltransferase involved in cell wall biosynthesis
LVALEAAARGVAAVTSDVGGLAETVIHQETGFRVPPGESDKLALALQRLLGNWGIRNWPIQWETGFGRPGTSPWKAISAALASFMSA